MSLLLNQLPREMIQNILEYLPLEDRKSASLVCRLWNQEAFSKRLQSSLVQLRIAENMIPYERTLDVLQNTSRSYPNLLVDFRKAEDSTANQFAFVTQVLDVLGCKAEKFTIVRICTWVQLWECLTRMPNLKHLTAKVMGEENRLLKQRMVLPALMNLYSLDMQICNGEALGIEQFDILRVAPRLQHFSVFLQTNGHLERVFVVLRSYAAQLRSLCINMWPWIPIDTLHFEHLQVLKLRGSLYGDNNSMLGRLFDRLPLLNELYLESAISRLLLEIICSRCSLLMILDICTTTLEEGSFQCFSMLINLRVLAVSHLRCVLMEGCNPAMSVTEFHLRTDAADIDEATVDQFYTVFPNIQTIKISFRGHHIRINDAFIVRQICRKFIRLKKLTLCCECCATVTIQGFRLLRDLGSVEELELCRVSFHVNPSPFHNVERLKYVNCDQINYNDYRVEEIFPNLRYLEIRNCREVNPDEIADVRRRIPDCVVHFVPANTFS